VKSRSTVVLVIVFLVIVSMMVFCASTDNFLHKVLCVIIGSAFASLAIRFAIRNVTAEEVFSPENNHLQKQIRRKDGQ